VKMKPGDLETQFFAYAQMRRPRTVRTADLAAPLRMTPGHHIKQISRLSCGWLIARGVRIVLRAAQIAAGWRLDADRDAGVDHAAIS